MNELMTLILTCGLTFLVGIGIGAAITDAINTWKRTGDVKTTGKRGKE